jgi:hypothetical protein
MFFFRYAIDCPLCQRAYGSDHSGVIASSPEDARSKIAKENQVCSLCNKSWLEMGVNPEIALFGGGVREAT